MASPDIVGGVDALTPQDATRYWLSRRTCNDLFLLYCFTDSGAPSDVLRAELAERSRHIADLSVRVRERRFAYPLWVSAEFGDVPILDHALAAPTWTNTVAALENLLPAGVDAVRCPWRLHLFRGVLGAPGGDGPALVAVLQLSHALADGRRAAAIARALFTEVERGESTSARVDRIGRRGRGLGIGVDRPGGDRAAGMSDGGGADGDRESVMASAYRASSEGAGHLMLKGAVGEFGSLVSFPVGLGRTVVRGLAAERARRELAELTERGEVPRPVADYPPTLLNRSPEPAAHVVRMLVRDDLHVPGRTVTVVVLTAIGAALTRYLESRGEPAVALAAQVSVALPARNRHARNNYRDVGVELYGAETDPCRRADRIAADLALRCARAAHPLLAVQDRVTDVLPAPVLRRDTATYPMDLVPALLSGHTVVSSVNRGPADLTLGGGRVRFTGGFPALGAVMHLTHGVHGLGGTVTVSIHADPAAVTAVDNYANLLDTALSEVVEALRSQR